MTTKQRITELGHVCTRSGLPLGQVTPSLGTQLRDEQPRNKKKKLGNDLQLQPQKCIVMKPLGYKPNPTNLSLLSS